MAQQQNKFFEKAGEYMAKKPDKDEDEFDILGRRIAVHFRNMESYQCLFAEKIISDVLIHGPMNQLTMNSAFVLTPQPSNNDIDERESVSGFSEHTIVVDPDDFFPTVQLQPPSYNISNAEISEFLKVKTNKNLKTKKYTQN